MCKSFRTNLNVPVSMSILKTNLNNRKKIKLGDFRSDTFLLNIKKNIYWVVTDLPHIHTPCPPPPMLCEKRLFPETGSPGALLADIHRPPPASPTRLKSRYCGPSGPQQANGKKLASILMVWVIWVVPKRHESNSRHEDFRPSSVRPFALR